MVRQTAQTAVGISANECGTGSFSECNLRWVVFKLYSGSLGWGARARGRRVEGPRLTSSCQYDTPPTVLT
jgi:hypothetical protein